MDQKLTFQKMMTALFFLIAFIGCTGSKSGSSVVDSPSVTTPAKTTLKNFAIYYGWPSSLNSSTLGWSNPAVANFLKQYHLVVFGGGLENSAHGDYANTVAITAAIKGTTGIYGYVAIGSTNSYSLSTIQAKIDDWKNNINVDGIFLDEFGFDFKLSGYTDADMRTRQKAIVDYVHAAGLKVFINAWDPDDVFTKQSGNPLTFTSGDKYLFESYIFSSGTRQTFSAYRSKVDKLKAAILQTGIDVYAVSTTTAANSSFVQADFNFLIMSAMADGFQGVSWGTDNFSASSADMPFRTNTTLFVEYTPDGSPVVDTSAGTVSFHHSSGTVQLNYSTGTYTVQ